LVYEFAGDVVTTGEEFFKARCTSTSEIDILNSCQEGEIVQFKHKEEKILPSGQTIKVARHTTFIFI